jgi:hypothetical protein
VPIAGSRALTISVASGLALFKLPRQIPTPGSFCRASTTRRFEPEKFGSPITHGSLPRALKQPHPGQVEGEAGGPESLRFLPLCETDAGASRHTYEPAIGLARADAATAWQRRFRLAVALGRGFGAHVIGWRPAARPATVGNKLPKPTKHPPRRHSENVSPPGAAGAEVATPCERAARCCFVRASSAVEAWAEKPISARQDVAEQLLGPALVVRCIDMSYPGWSRRRVMCMAYRIACIARPRFLGREKLPCYCPWPEGKGEPKRTRWMGTWK